VEQAVDAPHERERYVQSVCLMPWPGLKVAQNLEQLWIDRFNAIPVLGTLRAVDAAFCHAEEVGEGLDRLMAGQAMKELRLEACEAKQAQQIPVYENIAIDVGAAFDGKVELAQNEQDQLPEGSVVVV